MTGRRYSLAEISKITNISKITLSDRKMAITKSRSNRSRKSTKGNKRHMEAHICMNSKTHRLTLNQLIKNLHLDATENIVRKTFREFGYDHKIAQRRSFLKIRDRNARLQYANIIDIEQ